MVDTSALEPGTVIAGRYRVAEKIGHGGMGAVYLVHHVHTDEGLALKVLHPQVLRDADAVERFRREARAPARITSEHVARVTDADTAADLDGAPFYVMELLRGRDLERKLAESGPMPPGEVVEYLRQAARALDKAHAIGIVHRDLKPENLFLTERDDGSPCIKLLDFGIARIADGDTTKLSTQVGYVFGTPNYMAPEQAIGEQDKIGPATDVWAIGLIAFKLMVGKEFFSGTTAQALYAQVLVEPLTPPSARGSTLGPEFDAWFSRCVNRTIAERFASVGEAVAALARAFGLVLPERYSSADLSGALRAAGSDASLVPSTPFLPPAPPSSVSALPALSAPAITAAAAPPTVLPAGVPAATSPAKGFLIAGGLAFLLLGGVGVAYALRRSEPTPAQGIIATSASVPAPSAEAAVATAEPSAVASAALAPATGAHREGRSKGGAKSAPAAPAGAGKESAPKEDTATLSSDQKKRLAALDRLCSQGTFTAAECQSKRAAIIHGGH